MSDIDKAADLLMDCSYFIRGGAKTPSIAAIENAAIALRAEELRLLRKIEALIREAQDAFDMGYRAAGGEIIPISQLNVLPKKTET